MMTKQKKYDPPRDVRDSPWLIVVMVAAIAVLGALGGCALPAGAERAIHAQVDASYGMTRTLEEGVEEFGVRRLVTYRELVQYVYALRYGAAAVAYSLELAPYDGDQAAPDREAMAPPGGWDLPTAPAEQGLGSSGGGGVTPAEVR